MNVRAEYERRCTEVSDIAAHLPRLYDFAAIGDAQVIELGTRSGNSTSAFLAAVEEHGGHVWSVDLDAAPDGFDHPQWTFIRGNDLAAATLDSLPRWVDVVLIDTVHTMSQTYVELDEYAPRVRPGGCVLLHDTELEIPPIPVASDPPFPVRVAVDTYCAAHGLTPEYVSGSYGLAVIRIP